MEATPFQIAVVCGACSVNANGSTAGSPLMRARLAAMRGMVVSAAEPRKKPVLP